MTTPYLKSNETKLMLQVKKDLARHESFREFAYPDVLSKLFQATRKMNLPWGYAPAREIVPPGMDLEDGAPWTVGHGFTEGVTPDSRMNQITSERKLEEKILAMDGVLKRTLSWYADASFVTRTILINMAFNMGLAGLLTFRNTLRYIKEKSYKQAAANMRKSLWYRQVKTRAEELARRMETQEIPAAYKAPERL